jgi:hypothetical protein
VEEEKKYLEFNFSDDFSTDKFVQDLMILVKLNKIPIFKNHSFNIEKCPNSMNKEEFFSGFTFLTNFRYFKANPLFFKRRI